MLVYMEPACHDMAYFSETKRSTRRVPMLRKKKRKNSSFSLNFMLGAAKISYYGVCFLFFFP